MNARSRRGRRPRLGAVVLLMAAGSSWLVDPAEADVVRDGSLGTEAVTRQGNTYLIGPDAGAVRGGNLFHSFSQFNVAAGEVASFTGPDTLSNVIARVTGGTPSQIDGTIQCKISGSTTLFLINPAGIAFGPGAALDVDGSFVASTASTLVLTDGTVFDAREGTTPAVLTSASPQSFGFLGNVPAAAVTVGAAGMPQAQLTVPEGQSLSVVAGPIQIVNGRLAAPGGRVNLISKGPALVVDNVPGLLDLAETVMMDETPNDFGAEFAPPLGGGEVSLAENSSVDVSGPSGGRVHVEAASLQLQDSTFLAQTTEGTGLGVSVAVNDLFGLVRSRIDTSTSGSGRAGEVRVTAGRVLLDARGTTDPVGIFADSLGVSGGVAPGRIRVVLSVEDVPLDQLDVFLVDPSATEPEFEGVRLVLHELDEGEPALQGTTIAGAVFDDAAASGVEITGGTPPYTGEFKPVDTLAGFHEKEAGGQWNLLVKRADGNDGGKLQSWTLKIGSEVDLTRSAAEDITAEGLFSPIDVDPLTPPIDAVTGTSEAGFAGNIQVLVPVTPQPTVEVFGTPILRARGINDGVKSGIAVLDRPQTDEAPNVLLDGKSGTISAEQDIIRFLRGGVVRDATLNPDAAGPVLRVNNDFIIRAEDGQTRGANLFHSFSELSIDGSEGLVFKGPEAPVADAPPIANILARVTGGEPSELRGRVKSEVPDATLFLINPAGLVFGPNSVLDLQGSLVVSTAESVGLGSTGRFAASAASLASTVLTGDAPTTFRIGPDAGTVRVFGAFRPGELGFEPFVEAGLGVGEGRVFSLVGGKVEIESRIVGRLAGLDDPPIGRVNIVAGGPGAEVTLAGGDLLSDPVVTGPRADVVLTRSANVRADGSPAGRIAVRAANLDMAVDTQLSSRSTGGDAPGEAGLGIDIDLTEALTLRQGSINSEGENFRGAGGIRLKATSVLLDGAPGEEPSFRLNPIFGVTAATRGAGNGGEVVFDADTVDVVGGARVVAFTEGAGNGGTVRFDDVENVRIAGSGSSISVESRAANGGRGGDIVIRGGTLELSDRAAVSAATLGTGEAGTIEVRTSLSTSITGGATVSTSAPQSGGGNIRILVNAPESGQQPSVAPAASGSAPNSAAVAAAPTLGVADTLVISGGGKVTAQAGNNGGNVQLYAPRTIVIDAPPRGTDGAGGPGAVPFDAVTAAADGGNGGNIHLGPVPADSVVGRDPEYIPVAPARKPDVQLRGVTLDASAAQGGSGGNIAVTARVLYDDLSIEDESEFNVSSGFGTPGTLLLDVVDLDRVPELAVLSAELTDVSAQLQAACGLALPGEVSSFIATGGGGLPAGPDAPWPVFDLRMPAGAAAAPARTTTVPPTAQPRRESVSLRKAR